MGHNEDSTEIEVCSNTVLLKKDRKIPSKQPNPTSKRTIGITTNNAQNE